MTEDFYDVLGVSKNADEDEITSAYRKQAARHHPDVSEDENAEEQFKKIQKAKEVLTDDEKRQAYDQMGHERFEQAEKHGSFDDRAGGGAAGPFGGMGGQAGGMGGGGGIGDIFEQFFGNGSGGQQGPQSGADLQTRLEIDLEDAYHGIDKEMTITRPEQCDDCNGTGHPPDSDQETCPECGGRGEQTTVQQTPFGRVQQTQPCRRCEGEGELYDERCSTCRGRGQQRREATLTVEIPAGIHDGQTIRMGGEGAPGDSGARNGDLLIEVSVRDHPDFDRDGDDLYYQHAVSFPQLVFGDSVQFDTFDNAVDLEIPAGTQSGERFRLGGKGMPRLRGRGTGDLYVDVRVVTPESLSSEQREALEAYAEAGGEAIEVEDGFFERLKRSF